MSKLNLPRTYKATDKKFKKHNGKPKLSYSQYTSFNNPKYTNGYILGYIFGIPQPSNFWAGFGTFCGTALEYRMDPSTAKGKDAELLEEAFEYFNDKDVETLKKADAMFPENAVYEREIVLDRGDYVIQGFIDVNFSKHINKSKRTAEVVLDAKTGNKDSKDKGTDFYGSNEYGQTRLYARALKEEGQEIDYCGVVFFDRTFETEKTNPGTKSTFEDPILHLSGEIIQVPTPYSEDVVEKLLADMDLTAERISSLKTTYEKLKDLEITL